MNEEPLEHFKELCAVWIESDYFFSSGGRI